MDEIVYNALSNYYGILENTGYMAWNSSMRLLVLLFYKDFVQSDYRGLITKEDYLLIEKALDCLYGTSCLISYPDYLKMGKLKLGEMTEMAARLKTLEDTEVVKVIHDTEDAEGDLQSDVLVIAEEE